MSLRLTQTDPFDNRPERGSRFSREEERVPGSPLFYVRFERGQEMEHHYEYLKDFPGWVGCEDCGTFTRVDGVSVAATQAGDVIPELGRELTGEEEDSWWHVVVGRGVGRTGNPEMVVLGVSRKNYPGREDVIAYLDWRYPLAPWQLRNWEILAENPDLREEEKDLGVLVFEEEEDDEYGEAEA